MLTLARCEEVILEAMGGLGSMPADTSTRELVNATGHWFIDANSWAWSMRLGNLSTTADQAYVDLSSLANFRKLYRVAYSDGVSTWLEQCDLSYMVGLRTSIVGLAARPEYAAISHYNDPDTGAISARLELYPTPSDAVSDALSLHYAVGWWEPPAGDAADTALSIPSRADGLFLQALRAHAQGWREQNLATTARRLAELVTGPQWQAAVMADAATQMNFGQIKNSAIQRTGDLPSRWMTGTVPDP